ncbi:MAG: ubiquinol-cytochrome C reductase hinge domain-containing protein [Piptocephalis tieghemiana]|nr:MAG: ubiquinol-cytochrome C reductase hinge domain-containing protein [Piptocephalis tieghemiana]
MSFLQSVLEAVLPTVYAEGPEEQETEVEATEEEEEEEEEEEPEDPTPAIREACAETPKCAPLKHHFDECSARVENGSKEDCVEEFFHLSHCVNNCTVPKVWKEIK